MPETVKWAGIPEERDGFHHVEMTWSAPYLIRT